MHPQCNSILESFVLCNPVGVHCLCTWVSKKSCPVGACNRVTFLKVTENKASLWQTETTKNEFQQQQKEKKRVRDLKKKRRFWSDFVIHHYHCKQVWQATVNRAPTIVPLGDNTARALLFYPCNFLNLRRKVSLDQELEPTRDHETGAVTPDRRGTSGWELASDRWRATWDTGRLLRKTCLKIVLCVTVTRSTFHTPQSYQGNIRYHIHWDPRQHKEHVVLKHTLVCAEGRESQVCVLSCVLNMSPRSWHPFKFPPAKWQRKHLKQQLRRFQTSIVDTIWPRCSVYRSQHAAAKCNGPCTPKGFPSVDILPALVWIIAAFKQEQKSTCHSWALQTSTERGGNARIWKTNCLNKRRSRGSQALMHHDRAGTTPINLDLKKIFADAHTSGANKQKMVVALQLAWLHICMGLTRCFSLFTNFWLWLHWGWSDRDYTDTYRTVMGRFILQLLGLFHSWGCWIHVSSFIMIYP